MSKAYKARVELDRIKETAANEQRGKEGEEEEGKSEMYVHGHMSTHHDEGIFCWTPELNDVGKYTESYFLDRYDTVRTQIAFFCVSSLHSFVVAAADVLMCVQNFGVNVQLSECECVCLVYSIGTRFAH